MVDQSLVSASAWWISSQRALHEAQPTLDVSQKDLRCCTQNPPSGPLLSRLTFELAAKRLSADIMNLNIDSSATSKGESLPDTLRTLEAMHCDMFVVRHQNSGAAEFIARQVAPHISVINAGDGRHAHPTQAMLDMLTIRRKKQQFKGLVVAIVIKLFCPSILYFM